MANLPRNYRIGQRLLVSDWLDCTYLGTYKGEHRARVDAQGYHEPRGFAWYRCKPRVMALTAEMKVRVV